MLEINEIEKIDEKQLIPYAKQFSDKSFWEKIGTTAGKLGNESTYLILLLYYALKSENTPKSIKLVIITAIGYFISPIDFIPDYIPVLGLTDDIAVMYYVKYKIEQYVDTTICEQANKKLNEIKEVIL